MVQAIVGLVLPTPSTRDVREMNILLSSKCERSQTIPVIREKSDL